MSVPLDRAEAEDGRRLLDPFWVQDIFFMAYIAPPAEPDAADHEQRLEMLQMIGSDLEALLSLEYHKFWSQVVFDTTLHEFLDSYLTLAPRPHFASGAAMLAAGTRMAAAELAVHRSVFMTLLRMSTHRESKTSYMTAGDGGFADIVYENWLFDVTKLLDITSIYGPANRDLVSKMVCNLFKQQPRYYSDLEDTLGTVTEIIRGTTASCTSSEGSAGPQLPPDEMVDYVIDTAATLHSYILAHPGSAGAFLRQDMLGHTVRLYSAVVPWLDGTVTNGTPRLVADGIKSAARVSVKAVERCRRWLSLLAHELLLKCYADLGTDSGERDEQVASVLDLLDSILAEDGGLATDLAVSRPVIETLQKIAAAVAAGKLTGIDLTRLDYITTVFVQLTSEGDVAAAEHAASIAAAAATSAAAALPGAGMAASTTAGVAAAWPEITQVQDMLPGLGDGFVVACLEHFGNRPDLVINSILEETLPQKLASMPRDAPRTLAVAPSVSLSPARSKAGPVGGLLGDFLKDRHNIFDGDEFDVFSNREVDTRRIQKGKGAAPDAKAILNDKTAVKSRLQLYLETQYDSQDDEYDDTYDDAPMPSREIGIEGQPPLEPNPNRKVVNILSPGDNDGGDAATGHESSGSATTGGLARQEPAARQFTTGSLGSEGTTSVGQGRSGSTRTRKAHGDPEEPRWRTPDARPGGRGGGGGGGGGRRGGAAANEAKKKPAVDLSKRNEASLRIRDKNEKNKAARANHNRKKGADKKARAGMLGP